MMGPCCLQEPLLETMQLMQHTDVLIGVHGAGAESSWLCISAAAMGRESVQPARWYSYLLECWLLLPVAPSTI